MPMGMSSSFDLVIDIYADGNLIGQQSIVVPPGEEVTQTITVPVEQHNSISVHSSFVQAPGQGDNADQNVLEFQFNYGDIPWDAQVTLIDLKGYANSGVQSAFSSLFGQLISQDDAVQMIMNNDPTITNSQAIARYNQVRASVSARFGTLFEPQVNTVVESMFEDRPPMVIRFGEPWKEKADALEGIMGNIGSGINAASGGSPFSNSIDIQFIKPSQIIQSFRGPLTSRIESLLKGESVDFSNIEDELDWKSTKFIDRIGFQTGFDLTPNNDSDALGTLFIGSGGFSYNSFTDEWQVNNTFLIEISQPSVEFGGNQLQFQSGIKVDMKGNIESSLGIGVRR